MSDWIRVSKTDRCPQCGRGDWCGYTETHVICMRVPSDRPTANGGWLHPLGAERSVPVRTVLQKEPTVDIERIYYRWRGETAVKQHRITELARLLQIDELPLNLIGTAWASDHGAWAFPMVDATKRVIGIRLRNDKGDKWAVRGGRSGLFYPHITPTKRAFICEGATDVCALLHIGLFAIGRPSCNDGGAILCEMLPKLGVRSVVIVADHDGDKSRPDGSTYNPGVDGSVRLSERLPVPNCIWLPPTKDAREFVRHGGTAVQIEAMIKNVRWKQPAERN